MKNEEKSKAELEEKAVKIISDDSEVDIPQGMIEVELDNMQEDMNRRLSYQGITLEQYLNMLGKKIADFRKESEEPAKNSIKYRLVLEAICKDAKIEASDDEINAKITELATAYGKKEEDLKKNEDLINRIKETVKTDKAIDLIIKNAKIKTVEQKISRQRNTVRKS